MAALDAAAAARTRPAERSDDKRRIRSKGTKAGYPGRRTARFRRV